MAIEVSKYDLIYGKLLSLKYSPQRANELGLTLYQASVNLGISVSEVIKYIDGTGSRFQKEISDSINSQNPNGAQVGVISQAYTIPTSISQQIITPGTSSGSSV